MYAININCALLSAVDESNRQDSSCLYGTERLTNTCYKWISAVTEVVRDLRGEGEGGGVGGQGGCEEELGMLEELRVLWLECSERGVVGKRGWGRGTAHPYLQRPW